MSMRTADAATASTLNFQARLLNTSGSIAADGTYSVQFKLYDTETDGTGTNEWTETQSVTVRSGYLSVYLGSVTPFPGTIDWTQDQYMTMNVNSDGEMLNAGKRLHLTAVPYAFAAGQAAKALTLEKNVGGFLGQVDFGSLTADRKYLFPDTSLATSASPGTICVYNGAASNCPASSGSAYYIQNDTVVQAQSNFNLQARDNGTAGTVVGVFRGAASGQTADLVQFQSTGGTVLAAVTAGGDLQVASSVDTRTAAALTIGTTNATSISLAQNTTIAAGKTLRITGNNTAGRPVTPGEGTLYYDTDTKSLLVYANGKWQADRSTATKIVAASNSSQAERDAADYVATGANDQTVINSALTAAAGGTVYLMEGTYSISGSILIPNNTTLMGSGTNSLITIPNAQNGSYSMITNSDTTTGTGITVKNLKVDGNKANQTAGNMAGIEYNTVGSSTLPGGLIENVSVFNIYQSSGFDGQGIYLYGSNYSTVRNVHVENVHTGVHIVGSYNTVSDSQIYNNAYNGIFDDENGYNTIRNNDIENNARDGIYSWITRGSIFDGNRVAGNTRYGINCEECYSGTVISNNYIDSNGNSGVYVWDYSGGVKITYNQFVSATPYAIDLSSTASNSSIGTYLSGNTFESTTNPIRDLDPNTVYSNQLNNTGSLINKGAAGLAIGTSTINATLTVQGGMSTAQLAVPTLNSKGVAGTAGTTTRTYVITATDGLGETTGSANITLTNTNSTLSTTNYPYFYWNSVPGAVSYKIYRTASSGTPSTTGYITTVYANANQTLYFQDTNSITATAASVPLTNTTGGASVAGLIQGGSLRVSGAASFGVANSADGQLKLYSSTAAGSITIKGASVAGNYTVSFPAITADDTFCLVSLKNCAPSAGSYINNSTSLQTSANFNIDGTGIANALQATSFDTAAAGTLTIGGTNATTINVANNAVAHTINIGTGAANQTVTIGSQTGTSSLLLQSSDGGIGFTTSSGSGGFDFRINNTTSVFHIDYNGRAVFQPAANTSDSVKFLNNAGTDVLLGIDSSANSAYAGRDFSVVGQLTAGTPGIIDNGPLLFQGSGTTTFTSPVTSASLGAKISIPTYTLSAHDQVIALGVAAASDSTARAISVFDARTVAHQPTLAVFSPDENDIFGLTWNGTNGMARLQTLLDTSSISLQMGTNVALRAFGTYDVRIGQTTDDNPSDQGITLQVQDDTVPATVATNGTDGKMVFSALAQNGGNTSGTSGQVAGTGGGIKLQAGNGGAAGAGSTNGNGGNILLSAGAAGAGTGSAGNAGSVIIKNQGNSVNAFQVQDASGSVALGVDTANSRVGVGVANPTLARFQVESGGVVAAFNQTGTNDTIRVYQSGSVVAKFTANGTLETSSVDTISGALSIATGNATSVTIGQSAGSFATNINAGTGNINLQQNTVISDGKTFTVLGGYSSFSGFTGGNSTALRVTTNSATNVGLAVQAAAGQSADLLQLEDSSGNPLTSLTNSGNLLFAGVANRTIGVGVNGSNAAGYNLTLSAGSAGAGAAAFAGGNLVLQGGNAAGTGNANGGDVNVQGGTGVGTGVSGLVNLGPAAYNSVSNTACAANCTIDQANVDNYGVVLVNATTSGITITLPDPTRNTNIGRVIYITGVATSQDFTLATNSGASMISVAMRMNTTATMIWNGTDWTPGGASNATTLQATYNNGSNPASTPEIKLDSIRGTIDIQDADTSIGQDILDIRGSNAGNLGTVLFGVSNTGRVTIQNTSDQSSSFRVLNSAGNYVLNVNSSNNYVISNSITSPGNALANPGFETGGVITGGEEGWFGNAQASINNDTTNARSGNYVLAVTPNATNIDVYGGTYYEVKPGDNVYFEGYVKNSAGANGTAGIQITWYDKDKANPTYTTDYASLPGTSYVLKKVNGTVPAGKYYMRVSATVRSTATTGTFYFDDFYLKRSNESAPYAFRNTTDSTAAFTIQSAGSSQTLFTADTTNNIIKVGDSTGSDTATTIFVLDSATANPTTNLASKNGGLFYRSDTGTLKAIINGAVVDVCTTAVTCSGYSASASSSVQLQSSTPGAQQTGNFNITGVGIMTGLQTQDLTSGNTSNLTIRTGNATSGNSGNLIIDTGTASATTGNITIGHSGVQTTMPGNLDIQGSSALKLGTSGSADGSILFRNSVGSNTVTLIAAAANPTSSWSLVLPQNPGNAGDCLKDSGGNGTLTFSNCTAGSTTNLQDVYNNSSSPATITLADAKNFVINAQNTLTDPSIIFNLQCGASCSSNGGRFAIQNGGTDVFTVGPNGGITLNTKVQIGSSTADATQVNFQLDSFDGSVAESTCTTTTNQGAMYYNTTSATIRACINGGWSDLTNPESLGLLGFGIVPSSGSAPYDLASKTTAGASGPCKVSFNDLNSVYVQPCVAYSGGRRVSVTGGVVYINSASAPNASLAANTWGHLCVDPTSTTGVKFTTTTGNAAATAGLPTFSVTAPVVCLADVKASTTAGQIGLIYDTRTFTSDLKEAITVTSSLELGMLVDSDATGVSPAASGSAKLYATVVATDGTTSTTSPKAIVTTVGPSWVKANAGTAGQFIKTSTTAGYANTTASIPNNSFYYSAGNSRTDYLTTCTAASNCQGSLYVNFNVR